MSIALTRVERNTRTAANTPHTNRAMLLLLVHVLLWAVFLSLPAIFNPKRHGISMSNFIADIAEAPRWTNGLLLIIVFYFNYYVAIPIFYVRGKYVVQLAFFICWFLAFMLLNWATAQKVMVHGSGPIPGPEPPVGSGYLHLGNCFNLFMFLMAYVASYALCLYELWQKIKDEKLNTEILFLKSQVNPHFMFNTLNSIYSLSVTQPEKAPDAIIKLSGLMRYTVSETNQEYVSLSKELEYITNYIELQKLRMCDKVQITWEVSGIPNGQQIAPFLLIPFVENAFKYGVNAEDESDIKIKVDVDDDQLRLTVVNNKVYIRPDIHHTRTGLGINTTRQRLNLVYAGKHKLEIKDDNKQFSVSLLIRIK